MIGTKNEIIVWLLNQSNDDKKYSISDYKSKRSLRANNYAWELIGKISKELNIDKEDVYKDFIKNRGIYRVITINKEAVDTFVKVWSEKGLGWFCEISENKIQGLSDIISYYGSSSYNTKQMAYFIDYVVQEAKELGIETLPPEEIEIMKRDWR